MDKFSEESAMMKIQRDVACKNAVFWEGEATRYSRDIEYYKGLMDKIGAHFGAEALVADDGSVMDSVIRAKLPDLVRDCIISRLQVYRHCKELEKKVENLLTIDDPHA